MYKADSFKQVILAQVFGIAALVVFCANTCVSTPDSDEPNTKKRALPVSLSSVSSHSPLLIHMAY